MNRDYETITSRDRQFILNTYARYPLAVTRARGTKIYDTQGKEYTDLLSGISVCSLGHCHPELTRVMIEQAEKLIHVSNLFYYPEQADLAEKLLSTCDLDKTFFCNSGAEANEGAIKLARRYMRQVRATDAHEIITLEGSFHGRTLAALSATGQPGLKEGFQPLPEGFIHVPAEDLQVLDDAITKRTAAVMIEIIQGEGGVRPLSEKYVLGLKRLCLEKNILLIIDEVQTGLARTGTMWAHQTFGITPDIFTTAKALANGLPMGALVASDEVSRGFGPGTHATTFGGGPLLCRLALKVLEIIERDGLVQRAGELGQSFIEELTSLQNLLPEHIRDVRGRGLMIGIELSGDGKVIWEKLLRAGFICNLSHGRILRLLPPLTITRDELWSFSHTLGDILSNPPAGETKKEQSP